MDGNDDLRYFQHLTKTRNHIDLPPIVTRATFFKYFDLLIGQTRWLRCPGRGIATLLEYAGSAVAPDHLPRRCASSTTPPPCRLNL